MNINQYLPYTIALICLHLMIIQISKSPRADMPFCSDRGGSDAYRRNVIGLRRSGSGLAFPSPHRHSLSLWAVADDANIPAVVENSESKSDEYSEVMQQRMGTSLTYRSAFFFKTLFLIPVFVLAQSLLCF